MKNIFILALKQNVKLIVAVIVAVFVGVILTWWVTVGQLTDAQKDLATVKNLVSKHILLPVDEEPTFATVSDKTQLKDKFLATKAENGDHVLVYTQNQIAIIYRPGIDRLVAVGSVSADSALAESKDATIVVVDGSSNPDKTRRLIDQIKSSYPDAKVTDGGTTNKKDFKTTIVIDNTSEKDYLVEGLAQAIGGVRGIVPVSEARAEADIMIIVGSS